MTAPTLLILGILLSIVFIILFVVKQWKTPNCRIIHRREVLDFTTEKNEPIFCIYVCDNCGEEQHGNPPCEMCGYDKMKPLK